jgi:glucokinase
MVVRSLGSRQLALAIDIGGTSIKAGLIRPDASLLGLERRPTPAKSAPERLVRELLEIAETLCRQNQLRLDQVDGIGISLAGFITSEGLVTATAHLSKEWIGYDLRSRLRSEIDTRYYFALDTPAPTIGEAYFGAGRGIDHFVYVTVSTGIGAGIMIHGRYFNGGLGWAGGVGHTIIDENSPRVCEGCGNHGCLETFAATQGIITSARELVADNPHSQILVLANGDNSHITPEIIYQAALHGDQTALQLWERVGHALGIGLVNLIDIVAPRRVVVGGGISQAGDLLLDPVRQVVRQRAFPPQLRRSEIVQAELGDLSGMYGAAAMVFHDLQLSLPE